MGGGVLNKEGGYELPFPEKGLLEGWGLREDLRYLFEEMFKH